MPSDQQEQKCPYCRAALPNEAVPTYRPFSCPKCRLLVVLRPYYYGFGKPGCVLILAWIPLSLIFSTLRPYTIPGFVLGSLMYIVIPKIIRKLRPRAPFLEGYSVWTYAENLTFLAEFLDETVDVTKWSPEFDDRLKKAKGCRSYDDELENVAIDLAELYKDLLRGAPARKRKRIQRTFGLDELRSELRTVAADLRIAAK